MSEWLIEHVSLLYVYCVVFFLTTNQWQMVVGVMHMTHISEWKWMMGPRRWQNAHISE